MEAVSRDSSPCLLLCKDLIAFANELILRIDDELVVNPKVFPQVTLGNIIEIAHPTDEYR